MKAFFSSNMVNGVSKNQSFDTVILVKSAPKKSFSLKTVMPIKKLVPEKLVFWSKLFLGLLYKGQVYLFLKISITRPSF
jgi:hypothetical protein